MFASAANLESGFLDTASDKTVIVALAPDAHMHALFAASIFGFLAASLAHVESPADWSALVVELIVALKFVRAVGFRFS